MEVFVMTVKPIDEELRNRVNDLQAEVDDLKRTKNALRESEARYRELVDNIQDGVFILQDEKIIFANESLAQMIGYPVTELVGRQFNDLIVPEDAEMVLERYRRRQAGDRVPGEYEFRTLHKDGRTHIMVNINVGIIQYGGKVASIGTVKDITAKRRAEEALRESEERFRTFFNTIPDAVTIIRAVDGVCLDVNEGFSQISGWLREEVIGRTAEFTKIWVDPQDRVRFIDDISANGQTTNLEARFRLKNGDVITGLFSAKLIRLQEDSYIITITRDVSELKKAQKEKEELEIQLRQAQKMEAIGTLAGGIAHDFNNILAALMGYTEMAQFDIPKESPARQNLGQALKAAHRAKDLIKQILAFSRQTERELKPIRLQAIIQEALKLIRASLPTTVEIHPDLKAESDLVLADPIQIHQVVMNLCANAHQAMQEQGGDLFVALSAIELNGQELAEHPEINPGSYLKLTVRDTGCGMAPETLERIFDPYFTTKARGKGTGLGLAVVHGIISDHGGSIKVASRLGRGTTFEILLPRIDADVASPPEADLAFPTGTERILYVDDEEQLVEMAVKMLTHLGYRVVSCKSSLDALETFKAEPDGFDLVITDMAMPKMAGDRLTREILKIRADVPIIICTGYSSVMDRAKAEAIGVAGYLMKPLAIKDLAVAVRQVLDDRTASGS